MSGGASQRVLVTGAAGCRGHPLHTDKAWKVFEFRASTPLKEGLQKTIEWYLAHRVCSPSAADTAADSSVETYRP